MKKRKGFRLIVVDGVTWQYKIGLTSIVAYREDGFKKLSNLSEVSGLNWHNVERAMHKRTPFLGPKQIAEWLK